MMRQRAGRRQTGTPNTMAKCPYRTRAPLHPHQPNRKMWGGTTKKKPGVAPGLHLIGDRRPYLKTADLVESAGLEQLSCPHCTLPVPSFPGMRFAVRMYRSGRPPEREGRYERNLNGRRP